ncbi:hypothetical protein ACWCXK_37030 [Streptomyces sp. NPDC001739]
MTTRGEASMRKQSKVRFTDADFTIRAVTLQDLLQVQRDDVAHGWSRRWSSEGELQRQVAAGKVMFLCPMFRNGGPVESPESYRCWLWFSIVQDHSSKGVTLLDVGKDLLEALPDVSETVELKRVIGIMFAGITAGCQFESIW